MNAIQHFDSKDFQYILAFNVRLYSKCTLSCIKETLFLVVLNVFSGPRRASMVISLLAGISDRQYSYHRVRITDIVVLSHLYFFVSDHVETSYPKRAGTSDTEPIPIQTSRARWFPSPRQSVGASWLGIGRKIRGHHGCPA